jgi:hypothetical protein
VLPAPYAPNVTEDIRPVETLFPSGRSRGVTMVVDGFFAFVWFGWGQADAPPWLGIPRAVGTGHFFPRGKGGFRPTQRRELGGGLYT